MFAPMGQIVHKPIFRCLKSETLIRFFAITSVIWSVAVGHQAIAQDRTFGGYIWKHECDIHAEGYKWASARGADDKRQCPYGISPSFQEGCIAFIQNPSRGSDEDDLENPVGVGIVQPSGR